MAESPSQQPPSPTAPPPSDSSEYWCYQCDKRVPVETQPDHSDAVVCFECKSGFVESIPTAVAPRVSDQIDDTFIQVLRLLAQAARDGDEEDDAPPPPPSDRLDPSDDNDYLRIELDGWNNVNDSDNHDDAEEEEEVEEEGERNEEDGEGQDRDRDRSDDDVDYEENEEEYDNPDDEDDLRRRRRDALRRLRDIASRAANRRNRILDWAEILMGLEDHSIEFRLQVPDMDEYVGNPGDYVDAAGYEALLQNLAETDSGGRRGAPPAAKSAVIGLETVEMKSEMEAELCAICKETVCVGGMAKKLPCGHGYHGDCIVPWLSSRNSCPVCRYELPTDDPEYEEDRKKRCGECPSRSGGAVN